MLTTLVLAATLQASPQTSIIECWIGNDVGPAERSLVVERPATEFGLHFRVRSDFHDALAASVDGVTAPESRSHGARPLRILGRKDAIHAVEAPRPGVRTLCFGLLPGVFRRALGPASDPVIEIPELR